MTRSGGWFCGLLLWPVFSLAQGPTPRLHLSLDGTITPTSGTNAAPRVNFAAGYQPGVRGQALYLDTAKHLLTVPIDGYVSSHGATLVFWVKKLDGNQFNLMAGGFGTIGQAWWHGNLQYDGLPLPMLMGGWDMIAIATDAQGRTAYFDGLRVAQGTALAPKGVIVFGDQSGPSEHSPQARFLLDDVMIFDRALNEQEVFNLYNITAARAVEPVVQTGVRKTPPMLDGKVTPEKWAGAAQIAGFVDAATGFNAISPTRAYILDDPQCLYVGIVSETPLEAMQAIQATVGMRGYVFQKATKPGELGGDDTFRIALAGDYAKSAPLYTLTFNNAGIVSVQRDGQPVASRVKVATSTHIDSGWQAEVAIPWTETGITPQSGAALGFNVTRSWRALREGQADTWAWGTSRTNGTVTPVPLGRLVLGGAGDVITRLRQVSNVSAGLVDLRVELENVGPDNRMVKLNIGSGSSPTPQERGSALPGDTWEYQADKVVSLAPGERQEIAFAAQLKNVETRRLTFEAKEGDRVIQRAQFPVFMASLTQVKTAHYPSLNILRVQPDITRVAPTNRPDLMLEAWIAIPGQPTALAKGVLTAPTNAEAWVEVKTDKLPAGRYKAHYRVTKGKDVILQGEVPYHKRSLASFPWYGNAVGKKDEVIPPFEPVRRAGNLLKVWHRTYDVGTSLLPRQIVNYVPEWSAGWVAAPDLEKPGSSSPTLARPMAVVVTAADGRMYRSSDGKARVTWKEVKPTRVTWQAIQQVGPVKITADCFMEYDGFVNVALAIEATQPIQEAKLEFPYRPAWATLANYYEYHPRNNGRFPQKLEDPWTASQPVWVGNEVGGTQWFTDDGWVPQADFGKARRLKEKSAALVLEKTPGAHVMRVMLANQPINAGESIRVHFGLITTPAKPIPTNRLAGRGRAYAPGYSFYTDINRHEFDPSHALGGLGRSSDTPGGPMGNAGCYVTIGGLRDNSPDVEYWADDFMGYPRTRQINNSWGMQTYAVSPASPAYVDYFVWWNGAEQVRRQRVAGFYSDCSPRGEGGNYLQGRELVKRLYLSFLEPNPEGTAAEFHQSGMWYGGWQFSFNDAHLDGECMVSLLTKEKPGYQHYYPVDAFRAQLLGYQFGIPTAILDQFGRSGAIPATAEAWKKWGSNPLDFFMALCYLHYDVGPAPSYAYQPFVKPWTDAAEKYGLLSTRLPEDRYYPYWTQKIATGFPEKIYGSFYHVTKASRTILVVANYVEQDTPMTLTVDWAKLGHANPSALRVVHTVPAGADAQIVNGQLRFTVGEAGGRMVVIE